MDELARIVDMLARVHDGDAWHGPSVLAALEGVDARTAQWQPPGRVHTIWEIALHIVSWRREVERRLGGRRPGLPEDGDWPAVLGGDEAAWARTRAALQQSHESLVAAVRQLRGQDLERIVGDEREPGIGSGVTVALMLHGIIQHDAYHAGQCSVLKKMAGEIGEE